MTSPELAYDLIPPVAFPNVWWGPLLQYAVIADFRLNTPGYMPPVNNNNNNGLGMSFIIGAHGTIGVWLSFFVFTHIDIVNY